MLHFISDKNVFYLFPTSIQKENAWTKKKKSKHSKWNIFRCWFQWLNFFNGSPCQQIIYKLFINEDLQADTENCASPHLIYDALSVTPRARNNSTGDQHLWMMLHNFKHMSNWLQDYPAWCKACHPPGSAGMYGLLLAPFKRYGSRRWQHKSIH